MDDFLPDLDDAHQAGHPLTCPVCGQDTLHVYHPQFTTFRILSCHGCGSVGNKILFRSEVQNRPYSECVMDAECSEETAEAAFRFFQRQQRVSSILQQCQSVEDNEDRTKSILRCQGININLRRCSALRKRLRYVPPGTLEALPEDLAVSSLKMRELDALLLPFELVPGVVSSLFALGSEDTYRSYVFLRSDAEGRTYHKLRKNKALLKEGGCVDFSWGNFDTILAIGDPRLAFELMDLFALHSRDLTSPVALVDPDNSCRVWDVRDWHEVIVPIIDDVPEMLGVLRYHKNVRYLPPSTSYLLDSVGRTGPSKWLKTVSEESLSFGELVCQLANEGRTKLLEKIWEFNLGRKDVHLIYSQASEDETYELEEAWPVGSGQETTLLGEYRISRKEEGGYWAMHRTSGRVSDWGNVGLYVRNYLVTEDKEYVCGTLRWRNEEVPVKIPVTVSCRTIKRRVRRALSTLDLDGSPEFGCNGRKWMEVSEAFSDAPRYKATEGIGLVDDQLALPGLTVSKGAVIQEGRTTLTDTKILLNRTGNAIGTLMKGLTPGQWAAFCGFLCPFLASMLGRERRGVVFTGWSDFGGRRLLEDTLQELRIRDNNPDDYLSTSDLPGGSEIGLMPLEPASALSLDRDLYFVSSPGDGSSFTAPVDLLVRVLRYGLSHRGEYAQFSNTLLAAHQLLTDFQGDHMDASTEEVESIRPHLHPGSPLLPADAKNTSLASRTLSFLFYLCEKDNPDKYRQSHYDKKQIHLEPLLSTAKQFVREYCPGEDAPGITTGDIYESLTENGYLLGEWGEDLFISERVWSRAGAEWNKVKRKDTGIL